MREEDGKRTLRLNLIISVLISIENVWWCHLFVKLHFKEVSNDNSVIDQTIGVREKRN